LAGETGKAYEPARKSTSRRRSQFDKVVKRVANERLATLLAQRESPSERDGRLTANATVSMARFTKVLAIVSTVTGVILFGQLKEMQGSGKQTDRLIGLYQQQLNTASQQLKVMQEQFAISQRPWLNVTSSTSPTKSGPDYDFRWGGINVLFKPNFTVTNLGNLPAVNVYLVGQLIFPDWVRSSARKDIRTAQKDFCQKQIDTGTYRNWKSGQIIYPSREKPFTEVEVSRDRTTLPAIDPKSVHPFLIGCAIYNFSSSTEIHQKGFIFQIERKVEPGQSSEMFFGQNVPGSEIHLDDAYDGDAFLN
jgi:hypothetical protein